MSKNLALIGSALAALVGICALIAHAPAMVLAERQRAWGQRIQPGDILFQDLDCGLRCSLIRDVTHSRYTHVGIVLQDDGKLQVWEAFEPVGPVDLVDWVHRGIGERIALYRLRAPISHHLPKIADAVRSLRGRPYDPDYQWDDDRIYCSELIAKAVNRAEGTSIFAPRPIGALGPHADLIKKMSHGRLTETTEMVSPVDLARSPRLERIVDELPPP
jgi:hypothetical protein